MYNTGTQFSTPIDAALARQQEAIRFLSGQCKRCDGEGYTGSRLNIKCYKCKGSGLCYPRQNILHAKWEVTA